MQEPHINRKTGGFTLVEILVATGIAVLSVGYFMHLMLEDMERKQWDLVVNDMLSLGRAVSLSYLDRNGLWPGQPDFDTDDCTAVDDVINDLNDYLPIFEFSGDYFDGNGDAQNGNFYAFDCSDSRFEITTRHISSDDAVAYIASKLPIAGEVSISASDTQVIFHIIKPRRQAFNFKLETAGYESGETYASFSKSSIECLNKQISVQANQVCVAEGENLGGYRIDIDSSPADEWRVSLNVRTDTLGATYSVARTCEVNSVTTDIVFNAILFCEEN